MANQASETRDIRLGEMAAHFVYPPTPDIATRERQRLLADRAAAAGPVAKAPGCRPVRLLAGALAMLLLLLVMALLVPQTRAALIEFFDIGAIRILVDEEPASTTPAPDNTLLDLAGETSLAEVSSLVDFDVLLPAYPADLGLPDHVYLQQVEAAENEEQVVILTWLDPAQPAEVRLSLYQIAVPFYGIKQATLKVIRETRVGGNVAFWVEGPHRLQLQSGDYQESFLVPGNVLLWTDGQMTYRLESGLPMEEAVHIGESLARME